MENLENLETIIDNQNNKNKFQIFIFIVLMFCVSIFFYFYSLIQAPKNFKLNEIFILKEGSSLRSLSRNLEEEGYIKSRVLFESFVIIFGGEKRIFPGDYIFKEKLNVIELADRISKGEKGLSSIKITIPEGSDLFEMAEIFSLKLHNFNKENFLKKTKDQIGYFFPDTYFFLNSDNEDIVIKAMSINFNKKTKTVFSVFEGLTDGEKKIKEIIVMASIIEKEANGEKDRNIISGILWKRLSIGMPLQVDAAPVTYKEKGLPSLPISNPGIATIESALNPINSSYLYYIHDKEGNTYFAKTFKEHRQNIEKYLK